ncbi:hypothetical protein ACQR1Y_23705 [Bradyrhizobium sp. HKCCYLRH3099]|uniref:hypothetical protein n=1 Tax=unclassified Bradyrhizobium TaxID=2631580 RepID=UPI003EB9F4C2
MTHLPLLPTKPDPTPASPIDEGPVGKTVSVSSRVVADGFGDDDHARICMLLRPWVGAGESQIDISAWPSQIVKHTKLATKQVGLRIIPLPGNLPKTTAEAENAIRELAGKEGLSQLPRLNAKLAWSPEAGPNLVDKSGSSPIDRFWRRMMNPNGAKSPFWELLVKTLACEPSAPRCAAYLPTPHGAASLIFTLQRGRALLEAIASADSPLAMNSDTTTEFNLARPWYREEQPVRLASSTPDLPAAGPDPTSPEHVEFWLAPYRKRTAAMLAGETPDPIWPEARTLARAILAGDPAAAQVLECVQAAHHLTLPQDQSTLFCASPQQELETAQRRLGALLSLPTLQRLFGFAFDLRIENALVAEALPKLREKLGIKSATPFVALAPDSPDGSWTLARFEPDATCAVFCPASWDEIFERPDKARIAHGLRNLARRNKQNNPIYDIITIDPALATENSINNTAARERSDAKGSALAPLERGRPALHNGGLRVIEEDKTDNDKKDARGCPSQDIIEDAADLKIGDRLMVGIEVKGGDILWRTPDYRAIEFKDPEPESKVNTEWIEEELDRRHLATNQRRRVQLDGAMAVSATQAVLDDKPGDDPLAKEAIKVIEDSTVALWGSDPAGVAPPEYNQKTRQTITTKKLKVVEELNVTRHFRSPSRDKKHHESLLSPALRFGWSYYTALAPVFEGGGSMTPADVARISQHIPAVSLPPVRDQSKRLRGRRFLRHERINAPMALLLDNDVATLAKLTPPQLSPDMYVRTTADDKSRMVSSTRRLIVPPPVPLQFAMLHDVLRDIGKGVKKPKLGLSGLSLLGAKDRPEDKKPNRARVGNVESPDRYTYYPDPAASVMMFGLKLPAETGLENAPFVERPIAIQVGARTWPDKTAVREQLHPWPNVVPIHLELKAVEAHSLDDKGRPTPRIESGGLKWLTSEGKIVDGGGGNAVEVHLVRVSLARGETLALQAWYAPTVAQLTEWFDAVESAGLLLIAENTRKGDEHAACLAILKEKLKVSAANDIKHLDEVATKTCLGAGGLATPPRKTIQTIASLVYRELLLKPNSVLASPLTMRLTHAVDDCLLSAPIFGSDIAITRRIFAPADGAKAAGPAQSTPAAGTTAQTAADFLNATPISEWGLSSTQQGATSTLVGGTVKFDPAGTGGLLLEAVSAAPFDESLDNPAMSLTTDQRSKGDFVPVASDQPMDKRAKAFGFAIETNGTVTFPLKQITLLKLEGLPLPKDGRSRLQSYSLQELMAAAWGEARQFGDALRAALPPSLHCNGARRLQLKMIPINRHAGLVPTDPKQKSRPVAPESACREIWLPAVTRPAPPVIDHVNVSLSHRKIKSLVNADGSFTVGVEQLCLLTIWHARPFFSSGEGEKVALVLWPPGLFARGTRRDEKGQEVLPRNRDTNETPEFYDEDLGPGGPFVTRWGADPLTADDVKQEKFPTGPFIDPSRLPDEGDHIPRAFMPVPISNQTWAPSDQTTPKQTDQAGDPGKATDEQTPVTYMAVALQTFEPKFDPVQEMWYFNLALKTDPLPFPRVRLGLVRYQAHAREDNVPFEGSEPVRLRVSTPVKEWVKPLPGRRATLTCRAISDKRFELTCVVNGPSSDPAAEKGRPHMVVEVIRHRVFDGVPQEYTITDIDGNSAMCDDWTPNPAAIDETSKPKGVFIKSDGGYHWSCLFTIDGPLELDGGWSHAVVVRETRQFDRAKSSENTVQLLDTGPIFIARIPIKNDAAGTQPKRPKTPKPHRNGKSTAPRAIAGNQSAYTQTN